jgi:hypothetical protein
MDIKIKILYFLGLLIGTPIGASLGYVVFRKLKSYSIDYIGWWQEQGVRMLIIGAIMAAVMVSLYPWMQSHFQRG